MNHPAPITSTLSADLDAATLALVEQLAARRGQTSAAFAAEAIRRVAESEADFDAFVQMGIDAADRGDVVPHDQVIAELGTMIEKHRRRCST